MFAKLKALRTSEVTAAVLAEMILELPGAELSCRDRATKTVFSVDRLGIVLASAMDQLLPLICLPDVFVLNAADAVSFAVAAIGKKDEDGVYLLLYEARSREWYLKMQEKYKTSWPWFSKKCGESVEFMDRHNLVSLCWRYTGETGGLVLKREHRHRSPGSGAPGQTDLRNGRILQVASCACARTSER